MFNSIVVVTDRTVLDEQLKEYYPFFTKVDGIVHGAEKSSELKEYLQKGKDIIITTMKNFPLFLIR